MTHLPEQMGPRSGRDNPREPLRENTREKPRESSREKARDNAREESRGTREKARELIRDQSTENPREKALVKGREKARGSPKSAAAVVAGCASGLGAVVAANKQPPSGTPSVISFESLHDRPISSVGMSSPSHRSVIKSDVSTPTGTHAS